MPKIVPVGELSDYVGRELGRSDWFTVDQDRVNQFADATLDTQYIHVDPERAKPIFGGTIAHGFLTLSLSAHLINDLMLEPDIHKTWINYGLNKVRFLTPVLTGSRIRLAVKMADVTEKRPGCYLLAYDIALEIEGEEKPGYIAQFLMMSITSAAS